MDAAGRPGVAFESKRVGDRVAGPGGVVLAERVIPAARYSPPHLFGQGPRLQAGRRPAYLSMRGVIFWAEETGRPASGSVAYKKMWPVLRNDFPGDLEGLVTKIINGATLTAGDVADIDAYLIRYDNFFILNKRAWFSQRQNFYTGDILDGKNFKGTLAEVSGVPFYNGSDGNLNHVLRCFVCKDGGSHKMLTEEQTMAYSGLRMAQFNYRTVINRYGSSDQINWSFEETEQEDVTNSIIDTTKQKLVGVSSLPHNYVTREEDYYVDGVKTNVGEMKLDGTNRTYDMFYPDDALIPNLLPFSIYPYKNGSSYEALLSVQAETETEMTVTIGDEEFTIPVRVVTKGVHLLTSSDAQTWALDSLSVKAKTKQGSVVEDPGYLMNGAKK